MYVLRGEGGVENEKGGVGVVEEGFDMVVIDSVEVYGIFGRELVEVEMVRSDEVVV